MQTIKEISIVSFMNDYYIPLLKEEIYHIHNEYIIFKMICDKQRKIVKNEVK